MHEPGGVRLAQGAVSSFCAVTLCLLNCFCVELLEWAAPIGNVSLSSS